MELNKVEQEMESDLTKPEIIIKALDCHYNTLSCERFDGTLCPYWKCNGCSRQLIFNAIMLIKEQHKQIKKLEEEEVAIRQYVDAIIANKNDDKVEL